MDINYQHKKKILLVNNLQSFLKRNYSLLDRAGFDVYTATSTLEALQIHRAQKVNLIIAMLDMPQLGGDSLCSLIRQDSELCKVSIILVCYPIPKDMEKASQCGANVWLTKPVRPDVLLQEVEKLLSISTRIDLRTSVRGIVNNRRFSGSLHNISVSGILCETDMLLNPDELITSMSIDISSSEIIAGGKVVRSANNLNGLYNYGVQFIGLAPGYREEIANLVASNSIAA
jgi:two-component system chemotaxis response regulator CheY